MSKVCIGIPLTDSVKVETLRSIVANLQNGEKRDFITQSSCNVILNRNKLAERAIERGATHLFFVDSDMDFPAHTINQLLFHNKPVVGVWSHLRKVPPTVAVKMFESGAKPDSVFECKAVGTGLMLIDLDVFKKIEKPWFQFEYDGIELKKGEDVYFCDKVREAGFSVWCDPQLDIGHIGSYRY